MVARTPRITADIRNAYGFDPQRALILGEWKGMEAALDAIALSGKL